MRKRIVAGSIFILITLILEILPYGAALRFVTPKSSKIVTYSYFDPEVLGNGSFFPGIIAVLTVILFALTTFQIINRYKGKLVNPTLIINTLAACISIFYSFFAMTVVSFLISIFLLCSCLIVFRLKKYDAQR